MSAIWIYLVGYCITFVGLFLGAALWRAKTRKTRSPFPENTKLLRGPGETLRRKLADLETDIAAKGLLAFALPLAAGSALAFIAVRVNNGPLQVTLLLSAVSGLVISLALIVLRLVRSAELWSNTWLGYCGERIVAESLEELKPQGFRIFHDVPAGDAKNPFNIDHVIVGPTGVFTVETKTRRKGRARAGFAENQIIYDGQVLAYPWGEDRYGLDQAARQASWLQAALEPHLGQPVPVQPILTFPGWMVITRVQGSVTVLNPRQIPATVALRSAQVLDDRQLDLISSQLDARCRDVEF